MRLSGIADEGAHDLAAQIALHIELGLPGIEIRTAWGKLLHELDDSEYDVLRAAIRDSGLTVTAVDTPIGGWSTSVAGDLDKELTLLRRYAERAKPLGSNRLRIMSYPSDGRAEPLWREEALRRVGALVETARRLGVTLLHENCHGWASQSWPATLDMLGTIGDDHLRLVFDTGNGMAYGYDGYEFLTHVLPWVDHVQVKDAVLVDGTPKWVPPGDGDVRLAEMIDLLRESGYAGWVSLEPHIGLVPHDGIAHDDAFRAEAYRRSAAALREVMRTPGVRFTGADIKLLDELLAVASVSPLEGGDVARCDEAQRLTRTAALERGFTEALWTVPQLPAEGVPAMVEEAARDPEFLASQPALVMSMGPPAGADRTIVVNFHIDTVGPHIPPRWQGRRVTGRGAADDKGPGVAAMVGIAAAFAENPDLPIRVLLASVPGEEGGAMGVYGTKWLVDQGCTGRLMVFAEPTGLRTLDACSATMTVAFTVDGDEATDDHPAEGHNATLALGWLATYLATEYAPVVQAYGGKLTIGGVHTGHQHNRVYGRGEMRVNVAYHSIEAAEILRERLEDLVAVARERFTVQLAGVAIAARLAEDWDKVVRLRWLKRGVPPLSNSDEGLRRVLAHAGLPWADGVADGTAFTCDAVWAAGPGRYAVVCGPGSLHHNGAHTDHEWIDLDALEDYATRIRDLVRGFAAYTGEEGA